ncbi:RNA-binding snoRNP assembly protein LALA0_S04e01332g [Lachancea lanzarotensis]|uniref:H/ACA ribonucleoprotein complex non-core subunit NAF1 n=1 Tax=Lachancea lanzarotensis TaxID=1245769 RepID=A0A0C7MW54_9SACH|nr:uncharacterized protein LALA0_S04e01332g [Lachancea lanzarotensis]CEP61815.1 LALA0S04e01332g1_1 [Lachancea lanzarotensis]
MSLNPFDEALENPDFKIPRANDDIDVADISSDENEQAGFNDEPHTSEQTQSTLNAETSSTAASEPSKNDEYHRVKKDSPESSNDSPDEESSDESEDGSSDESSSESSGKEVPVIDDDGEDEDSAPQGPITSKNELAEEPVFEIPENFELGPNASIHEIGFIKSAFDRNIIIKSCSSAEQRVLKENSLLCLQDRRILGPLCEVFGPLQAPFYRVTFPQSKAELYEEFSLLKGQKVFYVAPEAHWHDTFELKRMRGTDASNGFDEELPEEEQEFSDDEKEAMHKRNKKQSKKQRVDGADGATNSKSANIKSSSRQKFKSDGVVPEKGGGLTTSSYRPRSARHNEPQVPEGRSNQSQKTSQYQQPHQFYQQREREHSPQEAHSFHPRPQAHAPYVQQQSYNHPVQEYQRHSEHQYPTQGYASQYSHPPLPSSSTLPYSQTFVGANYSGQYQTQPFGSYAPQQQLNPGYSPANVAYNQQYAQSQPASQPGLPQPQMMSPQGFAQPQSQNMQQVWQLQQILMDQQKQHQNNQHQNNQH